MVPIFPAMPNSVAFGDTDPKFSCISISLPFIHRHGG